jgi:hypothetical protein
VVKERLGFVSGGAIVAGVVALALIGVWTALGGATMFSPGPLSAQSRGQSLGGVATHAQIPAGDCGACHTAPWSAQTMADRCDACHTDVGTQITSHTGLHGMLISGLSSPAGCGSCHVDHRGPSGILTDFDHNRFHFKLTGRHTTVPCDGCHAEARSLADFQNAPQTCYGCHAKNDAHNGTFGTQCGQCHSTTSWTGASFDHSIFPVNHGANEQVATCQTCHPNGVSSYTCFGCHRHTPANVVAGHEGRALAQLTNCIQCHAGGRRGDN